VRHDRIAGGIGLRRAPLEVEDCERFELLALGYHFRQPSRAAVAQVHAWPIAQVPAGSRR